ncbi:MAG TPA: ADP-ribosylglycohydrolase family protein [Phycisphaerae bacterium]|nr:ADP-ribosylglycohydrolase family protein [Phycisphaerae bacterium]
MAFAAIHGAILGTVVGDAMGLPYEALSARRGARLLGAPERHRFLLGRGMMSDDGEHACMTAQALAESGFDVGRFQRKLAWKLRWWLLGVPAGIGGATLRATMKLWLGVPAARSGVFSAGNGPAMRAAVLGVATRTMEELRELVRASTLVTHTDPKAFYGAWAVALAARCAGEGKSAAAFLEVIRAAFEGEGREVMELVEKAVASAGRGEATKQFAAAMGWERGISGYVLHTAAAAIHAWAEHSGDYRAAVMGAIACGGDTDTVAAIVGGIVGSGVGVEAIPLEWREGLLEWPRTLAWIERLARAVEAAHEGKAVRAPRVGPVVVVRNGMFLAGVLGHLGRRALPPY